jgi:hypothetical protein
VASEFLIPVALDGEGRLVGPDDATKRVSYACPACRARVDLHAGEKKRRHFHHRASACSPETAVHASAKALVARAVEEWAGGAAEAPVFVRRCAAESCDATCRQAMPRKVRAAAVERALPSGHVADVALLARGLALPVAVVEIRCTHAVDDAKAFEIGVPWIEVDGAQVCADRGATLVAVRDRLIPWLCADHAGERGEAWRSARADREALRALVRRLPYRLEDYPAFRVERLARCARGHDAIVFAWEGKYPPFPRPPTVVARGNDLDWLRRGDAWSRSIGWRRKYVNVCGACGAPLDA